jgi:NAD(P)H-dependent flavin oxidoreductase YrpB (nitropropane dioxygenase family)
MKIDLLGTLGYQAPIFAFSHCRDVVVEVTKAGGFGVLGAVMFPPDRLEEELRWIDSHVDGRPYGVDMLIPARYDREAESSTTPLQSLIPAQHREFVNKILDEAGIPKLPPDQEEALAKHIASREKNTTPAGAMRLVEIALRHPQIKLFVSALGPMPRDLVDRLHGQDIVVGALCGKAAHVKHHRDAGTDVLIAQGTEAGGHTGTVSTMVLVPEVVEAAGGEVAVLAAGGISRGSQIAAARAMGADGAWLGTIWLGTVESELTPFERQVLFKASSDDAVQRKVLSGKPVRLLRSKFSEAWEAPGAPPYLLPPLQGLLFLEARARIDRAQRADYYSTPVGQVVGSLKEETSVKQVMYRLLAEYSDALEKMSELNGA